MDEKLKILLSLDNNYRSCYFCGNFYHLQNTLDYIEKHLLYNDMSISICLWCTLETHNNLTRLDGIKIDDDIKDIPLEELQKCYHVDFVPSKSLLEHKKGKPFINSQQYKDDAEYFKMKIRMYNHNIKKK